MNEMTNVTILQVPDVITYKYVPKLNAHPAFRMVPLANYELITNNLVSRQYDSFSYEAEAIVARADNDDYIGFIAFDEVKWSKCADILCAWVNPEYRGKGIHTAMFEMLVKHCREKGLISINSSTHVDNVDAQRAFERQGRKPVSIRYEFQLEEW